MIKSAKKLLLVDDDNIDRAAVKRALLKSMVSTVVKEAETIVEAINLLKTGDFDCVLLDYRLGGERGIDLIKEINTENLSDAPIIMLSGMDDEEVMLSCLKEGAQDFLLKSDITSSVLIRSIRYAEERKTIAVQMRYLAQHDVLTGLANRSLFIENVKRAIHRSRRISSIFAVIFIDLDDFKSVNDTMGHEAGDRLLTTVAKRIRSTLREEDVVARLGGDEFAVLAEGLNEKYGLIKVAQNILAATKEPLLIDGKTVHTTASLGIAVYPDSAQDVIKLIKCADLAMYKAKENGRNNYYFYSQDLQVLANNYANLKEDIHDAIKNEEFELYYQPQVRANDGIIIGAEALIRWNHPTRGFVRPDQFIPMAEALGLINEIGDWVLNAACKQLNIWLQIHPDLASNFRLAVNISAHQVRQLNLKEKLCQFVKNNSINYELIELEITESALIDDFDCFVEKLIEMNDVGIHFAIDDFGTGFSSFRHLQQLPLHVLKIDKSFIDPICSSKKSYEIVKSMIMMSHALNMKVIAEGVETLKQADLLRRLECDYLQGYFFWRPQPETEFTRLLDERRSNYQVA